MNLGRLADLLPATMLPYPMPVEVPVPMVAPIAMPQPTPWSHAAPGPIHSPAAFPFREDHPLITQARKLLPILAAISLFGASLAFSTFFTAQQTYPKDARALVYPAWSFTAFLCGMLPTLIWQVVLAVEFRGFEGRLFRSKTAILLACFAAFFSIAAGVVLLGLSLTDGTAPGVRVAGFTAVVLVIIAIILTMIRLCVTVARRERASRQGATPLRS